MTRGCRAAAFALLALTVLVASAPGVVAAGGDAPGTLQGNVEPAVEAGHEGQVAVVASGAPLRNAVPVVVSNGTDHDVTGVRVTAVATDAAGGSAVRAVTGVVPATLAPGELAVGRVNFGHATVGPKLTFSVASRSSGSAVDRAALDVSGLRLSSPATGPVAERLALTVRNPQRRTVDGPVRVTVMCFDEARRPVFLATATVKTAHLRRGATVRASVPLTELCPSYLAGARGR